MFENPRRGRQAKNFTTNVPKILDLKSSSEQIFSRKLSLGAHDFWKASLKKCSSYKAANKADSANSKCPFKRVVRLYGGEC